MGRANKALATRVDAIAGGFLSPGDSKAGDKIVVTGNPVRPGRARGGQDRLSRRPSRASRSACSCSAAARARSSSPRRCRRRSRCCRRRSASGCRSRSRRAPRMSAGVEGGLCRARHRGRGLAVLHRHGGAHRRRASGDLALRRLDRLGDRGDRPAGAAGALSLCARPRPGGQCGGTCGGRRRRGASAVDAVAGAARRADRRPDGRSRRGSPRWRPRAKSAGRPDAARLLADLTEAIASGKTVQEFRKGARQ